MICIIKPHVIFLSAECRRMFRKGLSIFLHVTEKKWRQFYRLIRCCNTILLRSTGKKIIFLPSLHPVIPGLYTSQSLARRPLHIEEGVSHVRVTLTKCTVLNAQLSFQGCAELHNFSGFRMNAASSQKGRRLQTVATGY